MGSKRKYMYLIMLLLAIGFGALGTSLYLNGSSSILARQDDFTDDVIFSSASMGGTSDQEQGGEASLSSDGKTITFNTDSLETVGDISTLEFEIDNNSTQYDADVKIECSESDTSYDDYFTLTVSPDTYSVAASSNEAGEVQVKLNKVTVDDISLTFKCVLTAEAVERTSTATKTTSTDNSLTAVYKDEEGNAVANAVLVVASDPQVTTTDENGKFTVTGLESGTHHIYYMGLTTEVVASDFENKTLKQIKELAKSTSSFIVGTNGKITMSNNSTVEPVINLYNMIKNKASSKKIDFNVNSSVGNTNGIYITKDTEGNVPVYYYRGNVNNNLVFNNMCWKIMHTTETGGTKLIYNGTVNYSYDSYETITKDSYTVTNDETYPFTYSDGVWTSTNKENSTTSSITITGLTGNYSIKYTTSSESNYDEIIIYLNNKEVIEDSGEISGKYTFNNLSEIDVIKIEYSKDSSVSKYSDEISFSLVKGVGDSKISCIQNKYGSMIGSSEYNESESDNAYAGYMFGNFDTYYTDGGKSSSTMEYGICSSCTYYYGTSYTFNTKTGNYKLSGTVIQGKISDSNYNGYYTCESYLADSECDELDYIESYTDYNNNAIYTYKGIIHGSTSYNQAHENKNNSSIKTFIDNWYSSNFTDSSITNKIEDTVYCNDRSLLTNFTNFIKNLATDEDTINSFTNLGYGVNNTVYSSFGRASSYTEILMPTLKCSQNNDKFTVNFSIGNGVLTYPVGLITLDEAVLAGYNSYSSVEDLDTDDLDDSAEYELFNKYFYNTSNYLYNEISYWTMSPVEASEYETDVGVIHSKGFTAFYDVDREFAVRPVISLKSGTIISSTGTGTETNPYVVE